MHSSTFQYLKPTNQQSNLMGLLRNAAADYASTLDELPDGPDKDLCFRKLRECAMWANIAITRTADGTPRANGQ
jgi:hypothetical protein